MAREPQNLMCLEGSAGKNDLSRDKSFFFCRTGSRWSKVCGQDFFASRWRGDPHGLRQGRRRVDFADRVLTLDGVPGYTVADG